jgi:glycosyltransferase involved in cell wall biosynthesis
VAHVITRLIRGGAQENTLYSVIGHGRNGRYEADLVTGPTWGTEGSLVGMAEEHDVRMKLVPSLLREINPVLDPVALTHLATLFRRGGYDIVHTHSSKAGILGRVAARMARIPIIVHTVHGWGFNERQSETVRRAYVRLERHCARFTDALITVTPRMNEKGLRFGVGEEAQFVTIRSGIEIDRYANPDRDRASMRDELGIPPDAPVVGSVMRLSPPKAPHVIIEATGDLLAVHPDLRVVIVGDGTQRAKVEALIAKLGLEERVILTGLRTDVGDLLGAFDVFVLPTYWEGLPRVIPQAMAASLPVVASDVDGNAEIVEPGVNGLLVPPDDRAGFARAILEILDDPATARRMGEAGRQAAEAFDVDRMVADIEALYDGLLASVSPSAGSPQAGATPGSSP